MAALDAKAAKGKAAVFRELQQQPDNKSCFDCPARSAPWASQTYGVFVCLDCSGIHRSLGTHISFIRSTTMDSWKDIELKKMLVGGNGKAKSFFERHGCPPCQTDDLHEFISAKYACRAAKLYKDKIEAEATGQRFQEPPASGNARGGVPASQPRQSSASANRAKASGSWGDDDWGSDDWGSSKKPARSASSGKLARANSGPMNVTQFMGSRTTSGGGAFAGQGGPGATRSASGSSSGSSVVSAANDAWSALGGAGAAAASRTPLADRVAARATSGGGAFAGGTPAPEPASQPTAAGGSAAARAKAKYAAEARADSARVAASGGFGSTGGGGGSARPTSRGGSAAAKKKESWGDEDDWGADDWGASKKPAARKPAGAAARPAAAVARTAAKPAARSKIQPKKDIPGKDDDWDW